MKGLLICGWVMRQYHLALSLMKDLQKRMACKASLEECGTSTTIIAYKQDITRHDTYQINTKLTHINLDIHKNTSSLHGDVFTNTREIFANPRRLASEAKKKRLSAALSAWQQRNPTQFAWKLENVCTFSLRCYHIIVPRV